MASVRLLHVAMRDEIAVWSTAAGEIEALAARIALRARNPRLGEVTRALGLHTGQELAACAAELGANIALLESVDD